MKALLQVQRILANDNITYVMETVRDFIGKAHLIFITIAAEDKERIGSTMNNLALIYWVFDNELDKYEISKIL